MSFIRLLGAASATLGVALAAMLVVGASSAFAESAWWQLSSSTAPTYLPPGGEGQIVVTAANIGDAPVSGAGTPVAIADRLPDGLSVTSIVGETGVFAGERSPLNCAPPSGSEMKCTFSGTLQPYERLEVRIRVKLDASLGGDNEAAVSGGEIAGASVVRPVNVESRPTPFGVSEFELRPEGEDGTSDAQAGSHPFQLTTVLGLNEAIEPGLHFGVFDPPITPALPKDLEIKLPPGLIGNPTAFPRCTDSEFTKEYTLGVNLCPASAALGVASVTINEPSHYGLITVPVPVFNLEPGTGEPARFGFDALGVPVVLNTSVRTGSDYGITVNVDNINESAGFLSSRVTLWGVPDDPRHDQSRGYGCVADGLWRRFAPTVPPCATSEGDETAPFLTLPTSCPAALQTFVEADPWEPPGDFVTYPSTVESSFGGPLTPDGCNQLAFNPEIESRPELTQVDTPTGLDFDLKVPQESTLTATSLAEADVKDATVTLPPGMSIAPPAADGLEACADGQFDASSVEAANCPSASQIGTVEVVTPLLSRPLEGELFVGEPLCGDSAHPNPCEAANAEDGSLFRLFLQARGSGVTVKLTGAATVNQATGQVTTSFPEDPQLPFSELKLDIKGGPSAPLANPQSCAGFPTGPNGLPLATTTSDLTPWSMPETPNATPHSGFEVTGCTASMPFNPAFSGGAVTPSAGSYSPFTTTFSRHDGEQDLSGITVSTPPGLLGKISEVPLCEEPQAWQGTCSPASQIGTATVAVGAGSAPFWQSGPVYLTGPYKGAPFGLSVVVPAKAGPFNLGNVVVRAAISVDPHTFALTVTSGPLPQIIDGVPLRTQVVNVTINRPGFIFNPTNCAAQQVMATITAAQGASANVASPFAAAACKNLQFKPSFSVSTGGYPSKASGASLKVTLAAPHQGPQSPSVPNEAAVKRVDVALPKLLPSRLATLQKACSEQQFAANPAGCPAGAFVGTATAITPVLHNPVVGPAILVSHGGAAFPDLVIVLQANEQGSQFTGDLVGNTDIKHGITYSRFESVPDVPITSFTLDLPAGPHSALASGQINTSHQSFCGEQLVMPTTIEGQNGAVETQNTKIAVTGCKPGISITKRRVSGNNVLVTVRTTVKGTVTITGKGLRKTRKTLAAGTHTVKVPLTARGRAARARHQKIKIKVSLKVGKRVVSRSARLKL